MQERRVICKIVIYSGEVYLGKIHQVDKFCSKKESLRDITCEGSINQLHAAEWLSWSRNSLPVTEPEGSLPGSHQLTIRSCPEPDESTSHSHTSFL
jgi:hypothetical protein